MCHSGYFARDGAGYPDAPMSTPDAESPRPANLRDSSGEAFGPNGTTLPRRAARDVPPDDAAPRGCPFLMSSSGGWRLGMASRDHRCAAVTPPAPLSPEKQVRLCLTPAHLTCATYFASQTARAGRVGAVPLTRATRWGLARTTTVVEDPGGLRARVLAGLLDRRRWPAVPAVLLVTTLFVLALSGFRANAPANVGATMEPTRPSATSLATARATFRADSSAPASRAPASAAPSASAASTPQPSATFRTYSVRSGDTLGAIANRFDTTVRAIAELNGISDPTRLQVGQILLIP